MTSGNAHLPAPERPAELFRAPNQLLAAKKNANFPMLCVKTGQPADLKIAFRFSWPMQLGIRFIILFIALWIAHFSFSGGLIFAALFFIPIHVLFLATGWRLEIPFSMNVWRVYQRRVFLFLSAFVLLFGLIPLSYFVYTIELRLIGAFCFVILALLCNAHCTPVNMYLMGGEFVYLKNVHPAFLAALPEKISDSIFKTAPHDPAPGVWRLFNLLVVRHGAALPERCLLTNQPASKHLKMRVLWPHMAAMLLLLSVISVPYCGLIFAAFMLLMLKRVNLKLPFSDDVLRERRRRVLQYLMGLALASVVFVPLVLENSVVILPYGMLFALAAAYACPRLTVRVERIEGEFVMIKGVSAEYLKSLPAF